MKEKIWKRLFSDMKLSVVGMTVAVVVVLLRGMAELGQVSAIDELFGALQGQSSEIASAMGKTLFFLLLEAAMGAIAALLLGMLTSRSMYYLRGALAEHMLLCDASELMDMGTGDLQSRMQTDTKQSVQWVRAVVEKVIYGSVLLLGAIALSFYANWLMALVSLLMVPVVMVLSVVCSQGIGNTSKKVRKAEGHLNQVLQEMIWQIPDTKALQREAEWDVHIQNCMDDTVRAELKALKTEVLYKPVMLFAKFFPQLVILLLGSYLLQDHKIGVGDLMLFTLLFNYIANGLAGIPQWMSNYRKSTASGERLSEMLDISCPLGEHRDRKQSGNMIELKGISACYKGKEVLSDITMTVKKGWHVAITGESGCGKSTLLKVIAGMLKPAHGEGCVGGISLTNCMPQQIYEQISMLQQETFLFPDTIRENLIMGVKSYSDKEISDACRQAQILDYVKAQEAGLDSKLQEAGRNLSGGQRQRLGAARALLRNTPLWILDEPTASLDPMTGEAMIKELKSMAGEKTLLMVTHHLKQAEDMDMIYYMERGRITERGTHEELLRMGGGYAALYRHQANMEKEERGND